LGVNAYKLSPYNRAACWKSPIVPLGLDAPEKTPDKKSVIFGMKYLAVKKGPEKTEPFYTIYYVD